ncbi:MAG: GcrA family cell cycle regulator [Xanthobacteraceae bacterium]
MRSAAWSNECIEQLELLWAGGATAQEIAAQLGCVSRSAVLGKIFRLRLNSTAATPAAPDAGKVVANDSAASRPPRRRRHKVRRAAVAPQIRASPPGRIRGKSLLELTNACCRWPHGRPGTRSFYFCGAPGADLEGGRPYCARHAQRAYRNGRSPAEATTKPRRIAAGEAPSICATAPPTAKHNSMWRSAMRNPAPRWR